MRKDTKPTSRSFAFKTSDRALLSFFMALALIILMPANGKGMTIDDIISLSQAQLPDDVLINQIIASDAVFSLSVSDILKLKEAGVSDEVILFMIRTKIIEDERIIEVEKKKGGKYILLTNKNEEGRRIGGPSPGQAEDRREKAVPAAAVSGEEDYELTPLYPDDSFEISNIRRVVVEREERRDRDVPLDDHVFPFGAGAVHGPHSFTEYFFLPATFSGKSHFGKFHMATYANPDRPPYRPVYTDPRFVSYVPVRSGK